MDATIRILGIAPYSGMATLMSTLAEEYPQINLTIFVGDMEQGLEIVKNNFHDNYDAVISRGGTAQLLRSHLSLPVIEVDITMYDILCAMKLANGLVGKTAVVSFANITDSARMLCDLLEYEIDIYTIDTPSNIESTLRQLQLNQYQYILCDVIVDTTAKRLGMNSILITSGTESIRRAFMQVLLLCQGVEHLRQENIFFRQLLQGQIGDTVVFDDRQNLYLSTLNVIAPAMLDMLRRELPESLNEQERRVIRTLDGILYSIRARRIVSQTTTYVAFFFTFRKAPPAINQNGIRFFTRTETESAFFSSIFGYAGVLGVLQVEIDKISQSSAPVVITGEDGTGKSFIARALYLRGQLQNDPLVILNCNLLNDKSWDFLLENSSSPISDQGTTIYFENIDVLSAKQQRRLLAVLSEMEVCQRNRVIFSCICRPGEYTSEAGSLFMDRLCCLSLYLPPLRKIPERIPILVNLSLGHLKAELSQPIVGVEPNAMTMMQNFQWPYNYTQFRRVIGELATTATGSVITADNVHAILKKERHVGVFSPQAENSSVPLDLNRTLDEINQDVAIRVVAETNGNQTAAAKRLGISRTTLWRLLRK